MNIGKLLREIALVRVESAAPEQWKKEAIDAVETIAMNRPSFTTDDVWEMVCSPAEPRAMGAIMRQAQRMGWIVPTNEVKNSNRPSCHARPVRVWKSELCS